MKALREEEEEVEEEEEEEEEEEVLSLRLLELNRSSEHGGLTVTQQAGGRGLRRVPYGLIKRMDQMSSIQPERRTFSLSLNGRRCTRTSE
ncbi:hypothetical protein EYF80_058802 [Liparis tanakae]|uniref:Uncharacterized protein n=1 Tax=Liparis tanakae TaxID=230148 RepID=A0A4Z2EQ54_9TELE|nr:hypothetical protein EYF80_058802 [Liparis tanakae]